METIKNRLIQFVNGSNYKIASFEKYCNLANGYLNSGNKSVSSDVLEKVLSKFTDLSAEWLMRGNGAMLLSKDDNNASANLAMRQAQIIVDQHEEIARLNQIIDSLEKGARHHLEILKKEQKQNTVLK